MWSRDLTFSNRNAFRLHKLPSKHGDFPRPTPVKCCPTKAKFCNETFSNPIPQHCMFADGSRSEDMDGRKPVSRKEGLRLSWGWAVEVELWELWESAKFSQFALNLPRRSGSWQYLLVGTWFLWARVRLLLTYLDEIGIYSSLCQIKWARCGFELWPLPRSLENW